MERPSGFLEFPGNGKRGGGGRLPSTGAGIDDGFGQILGNFGQAAQFECEGLGATFEGFVSSQVGFFEEHLFGFAVSADFCEFHLGGKVHAIAVRVLRIVAGVGNGLLFVSGDDDIEAGCGFLFGNDFQRSFAADFLVQFARQVTGCFGLVGLVENGWDVDGAKFRRECCSEAVVHRAAGEEEGRGGENNR